MATVVKDLGAVTAYAYAVEGGYIGTEAEFEALLGNIAEDLSEIENLSVTVTTLPAGSSATASYSDGVLSLGIPKGDKGDKGNTGATGATGPTGNGISTITKTGTSGLVDTYTITFTNGDTTTFTVTNGEDGEVTTAQMNSAIETALEDYAKVDGSYSSLTAGNAEQLVSTVGVTEKTPYLFRATGGSADVGDRVKMSEIVGGTVAFNQMVQNGNFANTNNWSTIGADSFTVSNNVATITGKGVDAYLSQSVNIPVGHKIYVSASFKGSNGNRRNRISFGGTEILATITVTSNWAETSLIWNKTSESPNFNIIRSVSNVEPLAENETIDIKNVMLIDLTQMFDSTIANYLCTLESGTTGAGVAKLKSWGFCTKPYYAYDAGSLLSVKTSAHKTYDADNAVLGNYALDPDIELRGLPELDENNNLRYNGDVYTPDGNVSRNYAILENQTGAIGDTITLTGLYTSATDIVTSVGHLADVGTLGGTTLTLTRALSGADIVYPIVTPTTESADPYQETQICNDFGTEEFVDSRTVPMPVGYNALYQANLRAKLEMAPDSPNGDGDYIVRQTDGLNEYVLLEQELPTAPAEDGTYSLKCTVASGTATLSWVSDS